MAEAETTLATQSEPSLPGGSPAEGRPVTDAPKVEAPAKGEPIVYADFTLPEGLALDVEPLTEFKHLASEYGIPQDKAQKLLDIHLGALKRASEGVEAEFTAQAEKWQSEVKADKEIGGNNLAQVRATVAKALDQYGGEGIREALDITGAGNNPTIIRMLYKMSKALTEARPGPQGQPASRPKSAASIMYPNLPNGA